MTAYEAYTAACSGDIKALEVWKQYGEHMGNVIKIILYTYDPEAIVFGGSISKAFQFFEKSMNQCMEDFMFPAILKQIKIIKSTIENIALLGAAALVPTLG